MNVIRESKILENQNCFQNLVRIYGGQLRKENLRLISL